MTWKQKIAKNAFLLWTGWVLFYALIMYFQVPEIPMVSAIASSMTYNYTYGLLSIIIWHICKRVPYTSSKAVSFIALHFVLAVLFSAMWLTLAYTWWYLFLGREVFDLVGFKNIIGWQFISGVTIYFLVCGIFYTIIYYKQFRDKELRETELKTLTRDAELQALKMQVNPHFLFNSLNSINALITKNPDRARKMMTLLSDLLRASLETQGKSKIRLGEELRLLHQFLAIEKIRFGDRMDVQEDIESGLSPCMVPAMLLQPLLENSVKHGIASQRCKGWISLHIRAAGKKLRICVANSVKQSSWPDSGSHAGTGLDNIRRRLELIYENAFTFSVSSPSPSEFKVEITLPLEQT